MPEVSVDIAGRNYRLGCGEGEQEHLSGLAAMLDREARGLQRQFGQMSEGRLMLMTALVIADRMGDVEAKVAETERRLAVMEAEARAEPGDLFDSEREESLTRRINMLAQQIEKATARAAE